VELRLASVNGRGFVGPLYPAVAPVDSVQDAVALAEGQPKPRGCTVGAPKITRAPVAYTAPSNTSATMRSIRRTSS